MNNMNLNNKVIKKKENIDDLNEIIASSIEEDWKEKVIVINYSDNSVTIECENSSIASIIKFEREKYLEIFKNYGMYNIQDLIIKIK